MAEKEGVKHLDDIERKHMEDVGKLTAMGIVILGNYSQTGHFGGPLAYTPATVYTHLAGL
jgi:hypothetical protein